MKRNTLAKSLAAALTISFIGTAPQYGNPTGPAVVAGSATVQGGSGLTTVHQTSNAAIINWQSFSINSGETTKFIQPSSQSAALNRVLGGSSSFLNGSLLGNGQIFLINENGVLIGKDGVVDIEGGFTASTRDISDTNFLGGGRHFVGHSQKGVKNLGELNSLLGNVVLIGKTVGNHGQITAAQGTVGLAAGDDVLLGQENADGSTITVNPSPLAKPDLSKVGVQNTGSITATSAELKAANGNIYSLAINNNGAIRATTINHQGGHVWLSSDTGLLVNSGKINVSATRVKGTGGNVVLKSTTGGVIHTGVILAHGGLGGKGGNVDVSGYGIRLGGRVDLRAPDGADGDFLIDPLTLDIITSGTGTISGPPYQNDSTSADIDPSTVQSYLNYGDVTLSATDSISIDSPVTWTANNLILTTTGGMGPTLLTINAALNGAGLNISLAAPTDQITTSAAGTVSVNSFVLSSGFWNQNLGVLPAFSAINNFQVLGTSSFLRAAGGNGTQNNAYHLEDVYGLQGIGSPSNAYLSSYFILDNSIDATPTANWTGNFQPIGNSTNPFQGYLEGNHSNINGLVVNLPQSSYVGLFGVVGSSGTVDNIVLNQSSGTGSVIGNTVVGGIAGSNYGGIYNCTVSIPVSGNDYMVPGNVVGGIVGANLGTINNGTFNSTVTSASDASEDGGIAGTNTTANGSITGCFFTGTVTGGMQVGGIVGYSDASASVTNCSVMSSANISGTSTVGGIAGELNGTASSDTTDSTTTVGGTYIQVGGLVGYSSGGTFDGCTVGGTVTTGGSYVGGLIGQGDNVLVGSSVPCDASANVTAGGSYVGGFIGYNNGGTITSCTVGSSSSPTISGLSQTGGFVGYNQGTINDGNVLFITSVTGSAQTGGFVGANGSAGSITGSMVSFGTVDGGANNTIGGFVGGNDGSITTSSASGSVMGVGGIGGFVGNNSGGSATITGSNAYVTVTGTADDVGGFVGTNSPTSSITSSNAQANTVSGANAVGGFAGLNEGSIQGGTISSGIGTYTQVMASGDMSGGFVGYNQGAISVNCSSFANVSGGNEVGGFVGYNSGSGATIDSAASAGMVTGTSQVGGFVGLNDSSASITNSSSGSTAASVISGGSSVGGFAGENDATIGYNTSAGTVSGTSSVGGFVGLNTGAIMGSSSFASPQGTSQVGGFAGENDGSIATSLAVGGAVSDGSVGSPMQLGGFVGYNNGGSIKLSYTTDSVTAGQNYPQVGGFAGANSGTISLSFASSGTVTGGSGGDSYGGFVGNDLSSGYITQCYTTENVSATGSTSVGGFSGTESGSVSYSYSSGQATGVTASTGGFIGTLNGGSIAGNYWLQDPLFNINVGLPSIGSNGSSPGALPGTRAELAQASTYTPNSVSAWDFTLGSGTWGVNGFSSGGPINDGLPFFQFSYGGGVSELTPGNQHSEYNGTPAGTIATNDLFSNDTYTTSGASFSSLAASAPVFSVSGTNLDAGTTNQIFLYDVTTQSYDQAIEAPTTGVLTLTPRPITVTGGTVTAIYGNPPLFTDDGAIGQLINGDTLGGTTSYNVAGTYSAGGYLNVGQFSFTPQITGANTNYAITYAPGSVTISPATLTYIAIDATGTSGQTLPALTGAIGGLLPGDTIGNATSGTLTFSTSATSTSPAGNYDITGGGLSAKNYVFVQDATNATALTLQPAVVTPVPTPTMMPSTSPSPVPSTSPVPSVTPIPPPTPTGVPSPTPVINPPSPPTPVPQPEPNPSPTPMTTVQDGPGSTLANDIAANTSGSTGNGGAGGNGGNFLGGGTGPGGVIDLTSSGSQGGIVNGGDNGGTDSGTTGGTGGGPTGSGPTGSGPGGSGRFVGRGGFGSFTSLPVPPVIQVRLTTSLSTDVRDTLANASGLSSNSSEPSDTTTTGVTDQNGNPAKGFYVKPGQYSAFPGGPPPPFIQTNLSNLLDSNIKNQLLKAKK